MFAVCIAHTCAVGFLLHLRAMGVIFSHSFVALTCF